MIDDFMGFSRTRHSGSGNRVYITPAARRLNRTRAAAL
jgi:hypothetical protein